MRCLFCGEEETPAVQIFRLGNPSRFCFNTIGSCWFTSEINCCRRNINIKSVPSGFRFNLDICLSLMKVMRSSININVDI